jgi:hypothetical protein
MCQQNQKENFIETTSETLKFFWLLPFTIPRAAPRGN